MRPVAGSDRAPEGCALAQRVGGARLPGGAPPPRLRHRRRARPRGRAGHGVAPCPASSSTARWTGWPRSAWPHPFVRSRARAAAPPGVRRHRGRPAAARPLAGRAGTPPPRRPGRAAAQAGGGPAPGRRRRPAGGGPADRLRRQALAALAVPPPGDDPVALWRHHSAAAVGAFLDAYSTNSSDAPHHRVDDAHVEGEHDDGPQGRHEDHEHRQRGPDEGPDEPEHLAQRVPGPEQEHGDELDDPEEQPEPSPGADVDAGTRTSASASVWSSSVMAARPLRML